MTTLTYFVIEKSSRTSKTEASKMRNTACALQSIVQVPEGKNRKMQFQKSSAL